MASGTIKVSPDRLVQTANEFNGQATAIANITSEMLQLVSGTSGIWTGDAAVQFVNRFNGLDNDMTRLAGMVREYVEDLTQIATVYSNAESENAEMAQSLANDVIV